MTAERPERWSRVKEAFASAMPLGPDERRDCLDEACAGDPDLRAEVESLLAASDSAGSFLETPLLLPTGAAADGLEGHTIGPYRIERELGRGGMGSVYLAARADDAYRQRVAIKVIRRGMDTDEIVSRFRRERQTLATLEHPNIARLLDGGTTADGLPYFVLEYVEGEPLTQYCEVRRLDLIARLRLFRMVCGAVQFAHRNLVVHRDLKPDNILVTADGSPKLLDFGIAKVLAADSDEAIARTRPAERMLTLNYASPEQLRGLPVSTASDVFSLGVMLYELLAGVHPFVRAGMPASAIELAICEDDPPRPSTAARRAGARERARRLEGDVDTIVMAAMRKDPLGRYGSAAELDEDIRRHLERRPVIARGDAPGYVASRFIRRHSGGVAASALVALTLIAGIVGTTWQAHRAQAERDRARLEAAKAERVSAVLQQMLRAADPSVEGRDVTVAQVLDSASARIAVELKDQPEVRGAVRRAIGNTYYSLGLNDRAERELREALQIARQLHGDASVGTATARADLASILLEDGDAGGAEGEAEAALRALDAAGGDTREERARVLNVLGLIAARRDDADAAVERYTEALAIRRALYGPGDLGTAEILNNLAVQAQGRGALGEAERLYREALAIVRTGRGEDDPGYAAGLSNLAGVLHSRGGLDEAAQLYERALSLRIRLLGVDHPDVTYTEFNYADLLLARGDYARALALARGIVGRRGKSLPPTHPMIPAALLISGRARLALGEPGAAERDLREAVAIRREILPPGHWLIANTESVLGECLLATGKRGEAERLLVSSYEALVASRGPDHERTRDARARLVRLYKLIGRDDLARKYSS